MSPRISTRIALGLATVAVGSAVLAVLTAQHPPRTRLFVGSLAGEQISLGMWIVAGCALVALAILGLTRTRPGAGMLELGVRGLGVILLVIVGICGLTISGFVWLLSGAEATELEVPGDTGTRILVSANAWHHVTFTVYAGESLYLREYPTALRETTTVYSPFDSGEYSVEQSGTRFVVRYAYAPGGGLLGRVEVPVA